MQRTVKTTTLIVEKPAGFTGLEATFKLIRYELPAELRWRQNRNDYGQMHNSLRDHSTTPTRPSSTTDWMAAYPNGSSYCALPTRC